MEKRFLDTKEAAKYIGLAPYTVRVLRTKGGGPVFTRLGNSQKARCVYLIEDLEAWLQERRYRSTADEKEVMRKREIEG